MCTVKGMTSTPSTVTRVFRVLGTTDEVTQCQLCGRDELKGTIVLEDNATAEIVYYGSSCGARAAGWTTKEIRTAARQADDERRAREQAEKQARHDAWIAARDAWISANIGPDALDRPRAYGFSGPHAVVEAYRAATGQ